MITEGGARPWDALHLLRIGCVQYLNSRPLIHGYDGALVLAHPSELADEFAAGRLDAALVPIFEVLRNPVCPVVDDVAIACDGPVFSVFVECRRPLQEVRTIALDPASRTSVHLLQVLLAEYHGIRPECRRPSDFAGEADAELLIGNQAIEARLADHRSSEVIDLGAEWKRCTGLPFVFAAWALKPDLEEQSRVGDGFRALKQNGLRHLEEIIGTDPLGTPELRRKYLAEHVRFDLREAEKAGIARYRELLQKYGFIEANHAALRFV